MFGYKGAQSLQAKLGHGSSLCLCQISREKWQIKNHISQCKIAKNLGLSPTTIYNNVKRFQEFREITIHVRQDRKAQVNMHDLWALRWHCIRNHHAAVLNIATWAQEYFRKPLSCTTVCCCIKKCNLNICYSRRKLCSDAAGFSGPELISDSQKDSENVCCTQMSPHFNLFPGKMDLEFSVPKKGTIQTFISDRSKSKRLSWYGSAAEQTSWVTGICAKVLLTWRHILGLYSDIYCHQDDDFHGKSMVIRSRQC